MRYVPRHKYVVFLRYSGALHVCTPDEPAPTDTLDAWQVWAEDHDDAQQQVVLLLHRHARQMHQTLTALVQELQTRVISPA